MSAPATNRLAHFIAGLDALLAETREEGTILPRGRRLLADLIAQDDWLPDAYAAPDPHRYRQYLLHRDSENRFSIASFIWGPGQATPVHDHSVWGLVGVLRGAELVEDFRRDAEGALRADGPVRLLDTGQVDALAPATGDIHRVANAYDDRVSVSIHVYGADIGTLERSIYARNGQKTPFVSGYADLPALIA